MATGLATQAAQVGQQLGSSFLSILSQLGEPSAGDPAAADSASQAGAVLAGGSRSTGLHSASSKSTNSMSDSAKSWCQKLVGWLREHDIQGDLQLQIGLDELDQPQVQAHGPDGAAIDQLLQQDPTLLQEFRELALDRLVDQGLNKSPVLNLSERAGELHSQWQ